jgi:hypothetical protein
MPEQLKLIPDDDADAFLDPQFIRRRKYLIETRRFGEAEIEREEAVRRAARARVEAKMACSRMRERSEV